MAICSLEDLKAELTFPADLGDADDVLMIEKIEAAQNHVERLLGYRIADQFGDGPGQDPVPSSLKQAVLTLAAHWYDARGAVGREAEAPWWVAEIVTEYRGWTF